MSVSLPPQRTPFGDLDRRSLLAYASSVWPLQNSVMRPWARRRVTGRDNYSPLVYRIATSIAIHHPTGFGSLEGMVPRLFDFVLPRSSITHHQLPSAAVLCGLCGWFLACCDCCTAHPRATVSRSAWAAESIVFHSSISSDNSGVMGRDGVPSGVPRIEDWYARHGRELVGCKSPVRKWELLWRT